MRDHTAEPGRHPQPSPPLGIPVDRRSVLRGIAGVGAVAAVPGLLAACAGSDDEEGSAAPKGDADAAAELTFWTWTTNIDQVVDIWNEAHPTQQVTVSAQAQ